MSKTSKFFSSKMLNGVVKAAESSLTREANSTSCGMVYQPVAPAALKKFSKIEKW